MTHFKTLDTKLELESWSDNEINERDQLFNNVRVRSKYLHGSKKTKTICIFSQFAFQKRTWNVIHISIKCVIDSIFVVSSTNAWSSRRKMKSRTKLYDHIDWIWRCMIRLGISFDILWIDMRIFSCHVTLRSHDRSIESRSFIILHDEHLDDFDDFFKITDDITSSRIAIRIIFIIIHSYLQNVWQYDHIHRQSFFRHETQICVLSRSSLIQMFCSYNYHNRVNPRRVFSVSSWILSIDSHWFFVKFFDQYCTRILSSEYVQLCICSIRLQSSDMLFNRILSYAILH